MEETLLISISRNVAKHCSFTIEQIKHIFYIFKVQEYNLPHRDMEAEFKFLFFDKFKASRKDRHY
jgi:hypothetical protein